MLNVVKRDGRQETFNINKIINAMRKAFIEMDGGVSYDSAAIISRIADEIAMMNQHTMSVEEIQDIVEQKLMVTTRPDVAKAYILYRNERTKIRDRNSRLVQKVMDRVYSKVDNRSNANVDEKSFSGREKEASSDIGKMMALDFGGLSDDVSKAHKEMLIYQHDLEKAVYGVHNCLNLNFQEIFANGFHTRNGDVRPPTSFSTACQLVAVAFQCQSQVMFGGVGSIHLDYDLAPFVKMSFKKHIKNYYTDVIGEDEYEANLRMTVLENAYGELCLDNDEFKRDYEKVYYYAKRQLEREGRQSAQGLFHNLNTLESRQGSQVPFSSINEGRDISTEGRLVTKWMLEASLDGIGHHHLTSIFPISIFQYKPGVNANPGDPNYDLKCLALKSMSKRIYPNWANGNWSQAHEDNDDPDTYFATMGKCKLQPM